MTNTTLAAIQAGLEVLGLNYAFMQWNDKIVYPYFVGEYQEIPPASEDGLQESTFILNGWTRGEWADLEAAKQKIREYFHPIKGKQAIAKDGSAVAIFYENGFAVPTGDAELKKIEIHLSVKEWMVI